MGAALRVVMDKEFTTFGKSMLKLSKRIAKRRVPIARAVVKSIVRDYKANAPVSSKPPSSNSRIKFGTADGDAEKYPPGSMKRLVRRRVTAKAGGVVAKIWVDPFYARFVEDGTKQRRTLGRNRSQKTRRGFARTGKTANRGRVSAQKPLAKAVAKHQEDIIRAFGRMMVLR